MNLCLNGKRKNVVNEKYEATHRVAPGIAPQDANLKGLPWEPSQRNYFVVQLPKLSDWALAPHGESFRFHRNFEVKGPGETSEI